jgi:Tfp pilus assembly protein PilF
MSSVLGFLEPRCSPAAAAIVLSMATIVVYLNALDSPFIYDDLDLIVQNLDIRQLWPPVWMSKTSAWYASVNHRPVVAFSLALNYRLGGLGVSGYHAVNLLVHICAGLVLFGLIHRTLLSDRLKARFGQAACSLATICALVWLLHPLQSQVVNYTLQRSESIMGFFYLATCYCFARGSQSSDKGWLVLAVGACALGMASKESMVTAPVAVLMLDRIYWADSYATLLRKRWVAYLGLALTWAILVLLMWSGPHGRALGFSSNVTSWIYLVNQVPVVATYLQLAFWPHPLLLDYGWPNLELGIADVVPQLLLLTGVLGFTAITLVKAPKFGFLGLWFFLTLSPTSSVVPIVNEVAAERRIYLPLAGVVIATVVGSFLLLHLLQRTPPPRRWVSGVWGAAAAVVVVALAAGTVLRNQDYESRLSIWESVVAQRPDHARAYSNLGHAYAANGAYETAVEQFRTAVALNPTYARAHNNLGNALAATGASDAAIASYRAALKIEPGYAKAAYNLGNVLKSQDEIGPAISSYRQALAISPDFIAARNNLANTLLSSGAIVEAIEQYERVLVRAGTNALVHNNLGSALMSTGRLSDAAAHFHRAMELDPELTLARENLSDLNRRLYLGSGTGE